MALGLLELGYKAPGVISVTELRESVDKHGKGSPMFFRIQRQDASLFLTVTV